jgi:PAS domain-containing protein
MESITEAYRAIDADWRYVYMNRAGYTLLNREPADSVVGKVIWQEMDITPEFEAAYRRARDEQVLVEVVGYYPPWDRWIHNRVLPTAGGLLVALVAGWPIAGARLVDPHGAVQAEAGDVGGTGRRAPLRVAAGRSTDESTDRDGAERAEPETDLARSGGHGPDPS